MRILIRQEDYSAIRYDLVADDTALVFAGEKDSFSLPYSGVRDFVITQDIRKKCFFTILCAGKLYEGQITEPKEIEPFTRILRERLSGIINIEVKKG